MFEILAKLFVFRIIRLIMAKVLIVEDDQFLSKMYKRKFELAGYEVELALDGEDGLSKMRTTKPNIVLMDIMMPKLNGLDAIREAKGDPMIRNIPVMVLTNLSNTDDAAIAVKNGAIGYLVKSDFTPSQVVEKVKEIMATPSSPGK